MSYTFVRVLYYYYATIRISSTLGKWTRAFLEPVVEIRGLGQGQARCSQNTVRDALPRLEIKARRSRLEVSQRDFARRNVIPLLQLSRKFLQSSSAGKDWNLLDRTRGSAIRFVVLERARNWKSLAAIATPASKIANDDTREINFSQKPFTIRPVIIQRPTTLTPFPTKYTAKYTVAFIQLQFHIPEIASTSRHCRRRFPLAVDRKSFLRRWERRSDSRQMWMKKYMETIFKEEPPFFAIFAQTDAASLQICPFSMYRVNIAGYPRSTAEIPKCFHAAENPPL